MVFMPFLQRSKHGHWSACVCRRCQPACLQTAGLLMWPSFHGITPSNSRSLCSAPSLAPARFGQFQRATVSKLMDPPCVPLTKRLPTQTYGISQGALLVVHSLTQYVFPLCAVSLFAEIDQCTHQNVLMFVDGTYVRGAAPDDWTASHFDKDQQRLRRSRHAC